MSIFQQFQHILARRTVHMAFPTPQETSRVPSRTLLNFNSLSSSVYKNLDESKYHTSPKKSQRQKYKDLRKRLISRGSEKPKRLSLHKSHLRQEEDENQLASNTLLCTKAIVHEGYETQEFNMKKALKLKHERIIKTKNDDNGVSSFFHRPRRLSQQVQSSVVSPTKRTVTENLRIKVARKLSETTSSSLFDADVIKIRNSLNLVKKPIKQSSTSYAVKTTRMEQELSQQIEAWNCEEGFVDDLEF